MDIRRLLPADAPAYRAVRLRALWEHPEAFTSSYAEDERVGFRAFGTEPDAIRVDGHGYAKVHMSMELRARP